MNTDEKIWRYLKSVGLNDYGAAGLMGNLYAESGLKSTNLQNSYERKLGYSDADYTAAVDNGVYTNFVRDSAGYGLAQWTYWSRKQALLAFCKAAGTSIGNLDMQLRFLMKELSEGYSGVLTTLKNAASVLEASNAVLLQFERPADQGKAVQQKRASYGQTYYDRFAQQDDISIDEFITLFAQMRKGLQSNHAASYSEDARQWAVDKGLIAGGGQLPDGSPNYMWNDLLTREQFVTVLYRFAKVFDL